VALDVGQPAEDLAAKDVQSSILADITDVSNAWTAATPKPTPMKPSVTP